MAVYLHRLFGFLVSHQTADPCSSACCGFVATLVSWTWGGWTCPWHDPTQEISPVCGPRSLFSPFSLSLFHPVQSRKSRVGCDPSETFSSHNAGPAIILHLPVSFLYLLWERNKISVFQCCSTSLTMSRSKLNWECLVNSNLNSWI